MQPKEKKGFIPDDGNTTPAQRNAHLSAQLAVAPWADRDIVRIERIEIGGVAGWKLVYYPS